jgi:CheY-like chemotaxis protein
MPEVAVWSPVAHRHLVVLAILSHSTSMGIVLIVDDDASLRTALSMLSAAGPGDPPRPRADAGDDRAMASSPVPRVLVVEDDEDIRDAIALVVEREGFEPILVSHGLEALRYLETCDRLPSVILLDLMMPIMDGWEFLRRRSDRICVIPVVVITAGSATNLPDGIRCLQKPISVETLAGELRPCWDGRGSA